MATEYKTHVKKERCTTTTIYLIRHGETEANRNRIMQGWMDTKLSETGIRQAAALSDRLADTALHALYSSDLTRAVMTAEAIAASHTLPLRTDARLREIDTGAWTGCSWREIAEKDRERTDLFLSLSPEWCAPGGESFEDIRTRMRGALTEIAAQHPGQSVAVVSHGAAIRQALAMYRGLSVPESAQIPLGANTALSILQFDGDTVQVLLESDSSHLVVKTTTICP